MTESFLPSLEAPGRILIVDDQPDNLKVLSLELRRHPFTITLAGGAAEALEHCAFHPFEGILMDVSLPEMTGFEVCRRIRESELNAQTPLIFLSAIRVGEEWVTEGLAAGAMDYLTKPYAFPELLAKLQMMIRLSRQQKALLLAERQRALFEIAGGAALEVAPYLRDAQGMVEAWREDGREPKSGEIEELNHCLIQIHRVLSQIQSLRNYVTKNHGLNRVLDLAGSSQGTVPLDRNQRLN